ncbi:potassium transporter TrkA [Gordonia sp. TBRC 11910]|uniref:Potassium transporter TrkA n=1 Tax=Gordonia asplenii TaxID=2725283 RepID=A0A848L7J8_9ACTN|nr:potassium transporter TrkA [Gordonia asplenii]
MQGHTIVCGLELLGIRIVEQLHAFDEPVAVVLYAHEPRVEAVLEGWDIPYLVRGASGAQALREAGIESADAVVCTDPADVVNLETALLARRLRADVRVVVRIANVVVRDAMVADNGPGAVLAVADLAAPSVVEDCLQRTTHHLDVAGVDLTVAIDAIDHDGTLRSLYGDLGPIAVVRGVDNPYAAAPTPCPPRDTPVAAGDWAALIGTSSELAAHGLGGTTAPEERRARRRNPLVRLRLAASDLREDIDPNFFRALGVMTVLVVTSMFLLRYTYSRPGMSFLDALYFSAETIATVGYGDFSFLGQPPMLRFYAIFLMVCGVTNTAILVAFVSEMLVSRRLTQSAGRRSARMMSGHVLLVGLGEVGIRVAADLIAQGHSVVAIELDRQHRNLPAAEKLGVAVVFGDGTQRETLLAAGLTRASAVAILTSNEMANIEVGLVVKELLGERWDDGLHHPSVPVVLRVFDLPLGRVVAARFGFRNVRSTVELAAPWFISAALGLRVLGTFSVWEESFMVGAVTIEPGGGLDGIAMRDLSPATRVVAIAHAETGQLERNPRRHSRFHSGDVAYVIGPYAELISVLRLGRK